MKTWYHLVSLGITWYLLTNDSLQFKSRIQAPIIYTSNRQQFYNMSLGSLSSSLDPKPSSKNEACISQRSPSFINHQHHNHHARDFRLEFRNLVGRFCSCRIHSCQNHALKTLDFVSHYFLYFILGTS